MIPAHNHEARSANFLFTMNGSRATSIAVQTSNISDISMGPTMFPTGTKDLSIPSDKILHSPLIIDFIISDDYAEWIYMYKWMLRCKNGHDLESKVDTCSLTTLNSQNQPGAEFIYGDAFPTEMSGIQYTTNEDQSVVITCTATLQFNTFKVRTPDGEIIDESHST